MRKTIHDITSRKGSSSEPLVCLTAYTAPIAREFDPHCDILLVGDSVAMVVYGEPSTLQADMEMMIRHGRAVVKASARAFVVIDMPFGSYQEGKEQAFRNAARILRETGAMAVKIEGGEEAANTITHLARQGIPVMGHVGLMPQAMHASGGFRVQGRHEADARKILADAKAVAAAGAFSIVLEGVTEPLAVEIAGAVSVPVIGIGASAKCDGQVLVADDLLGLTKAPRPKFVKAYADFAETAAKAAEQFAKDVRTRAFPDNAHVYATVTVTQTPGIRHETPAGQAILPQKSVDAVLPKTPLVRAPDQKPDAKAERSGPMTETNKPSLPLSAKPSPANNQRTPNETVEKEPKRPFFDTVLRATRRT